MNMTPAIKAESVAWFRQVIDMIRDGGMLEMPAYGLIYVVDKARKRLVLQNTVLRSLDAHTLTAEVCKELGYKVEALAMGVN